MRRGHEVSVLLKVWKSWNTGSFCGRRGNVPGGAPRVRIFPPLDSEVILFSCFLEHWLSMPVSGFMEGLLHYFKIQLCHLTP